MYNSTLLGPILNRYGVIRKVEKAKTECSLEDQSAEMLPTKFDVWNGCVMIFFRPSFLLVLLFLSNKLIFLWQLSGENSKIFALKSTGKLLVLNSCSKNSLHLFFNAFSCF